MIEARELGIAVPYVTNRAIMGRLDDVVGAENWYNEFKPWHGAGGKEAQLCGISIRYGEGFITKWDVFHCVHLASKKSLSVPPSGTSTSV